MVPERVRQALEPLMEPGIPWDDVTIHIGRLPQALSGPSALALRSVKAMTAKEPIRSLQVIGMTVHRDIWLARGHDDFESAASLALAAHELVHVLQGEADPAFPKKYDAAARQTSPDRPWENPYEAQAYLEERRIYCSLVAQGRRRGSWVPLGVTLFGSC